MKLIRGSNILVLADFDGTRANNFTLIRIFLAWSVLYGHSFAIASIPGVRDPLTQIFQGSIWIGEIAVNGFFALSGFLVTGSLIKRGAWDYAISRCLRIFPALLLCVFFSVFFLGPLVTSLPVEEYLIDKNAWGYLTNSLAFFPMQWNLPGVFEDNPRTAVNGSLWTLTVEVRCYLILMVLGMFGLFRDRANGNLAVVCLAAFAFFNYTDIPLLGHKEKWARPAAYFLMGVVAYLNRERVVLNGRIALLALILVVVSFGKDWFDYVFAPSYIYLLFYLSYCPPHFKADEKIGDISYGIYIYAWPVQQLSMMMFPGTYPVFNIVTSSLLVIPIAWLSWHYVEKPTLAYKNRLSPVRA